jgi:amidase
MAGGEPFIPHVEALINRGKAISVFDYWAINRRKLAVQRAYLQKWNNSKSPISGREADVILMANAPHCAVPHRKSRFAFLLLL